VGRRVAISQATNRIRGRRLASNQSQQALADACGITRQAVSAIESGQYIPNTAVALRLAHALHCGVEDLFSLPQPEVRIDATLTGTTDVLTDSELRVQVGRVGDRLLAMPLHGSAAPSIPADGLVIWDAGAPDRTWRHQSSVSVELLIDRDLVEHAVVVHGCDPALTLLGAHLARRYPAFRLIWVEQTSIRALRALGRGEAHAAGTHLCDPETGVSNLPFVERELRGRHVVVITLSEWQQGLIVARGNPKKISGALDLARHDVTMVNRETGAGSRLLLDTWLTQAGVRPEEVRGYAREVPTHLAVAEAVASGMADAGPGIMSVARALQLDFVPLQVERNDLVVPIEYLARAPMEAMLDVAVSGPFRKELAALGGYDSAHAGTFVAELAS
jgi:molybdate-binding protein/DNA-binding XRE family transcriptional regulator